ncbi:TPA: hypothetical protein N3Z88_001408 [Klebsiella quasipneumoniae subsp. similipneumoniae]|nr:hypothetical protein [Klebsiella quasipneumoniae]HCM2944665.1 hypothetical protein [Klebsiella quasipneumoniae subsp. similipneumoniae]HCM6333994.1 hypothetical protein [Klebsiella quasipneumoniae subsp. similipneumoniae]
MVGFIQRYNLSASRGAGSSILSANIVAYLFIAVLNRIHPLRPISLQKIILRQKPKMMRIASLFSPIFRLTGRALEGAVIAVIVIQIAMANAAKGFWCSVEGITGWWEGLRRKCCWMWQRPRPGTGTHRPSCWWEIAPSWGKKIEAPKVKIYIEHFLSD